MKDNFVLTERHKLLTLRFVAVVGDVEDFISRNPQFILKDEEKMREFEMYSQKS